MAEYNFIHIPKTGGTAIKYAIADSGNNQINFPSRGHNLTLHSVSENACFIIREPWHRFCSGYWERATMQLRREESSKNDYANFGYADLNPQEQEIINQYKTPNELLSYIRKGNTPPSILGELTASITKWTGNENDLVNMHNKIKLVFALKDLNKAMNFFFKLELPQDPFRKRSRALFNMQQSYDISPENKQWFENEYRKDDYKLIEYIKKQKYYYE